MSTSERRPGGRAARKRRGEAHKAEDEGVDYIEAVYDYLRTLGDPGDEVLTAIRPWLEKTYDLGYPHAARIRGPAMKELTAAGRVERLKTRGRYVRILS